MWRCEACASAYLSPRPSRATIHEAYLSYYTHQTAARLQVVPTARQRWREMLTNGYLNWRFGARLQPASALGVLFAAMFRSRRLAAERDARHLPRLPVGASRLLDVGCGDGAFLAHAKRIGWQVLGLEPDPQAADQTRALGIPVLTGGIDQLDDHSGEFDVITLNHVIEHVHDVHKVLTSCYRLLVPGGLVWIATPNVNAVGHRLFRAHWRGLEAPRHLVLFSRASLANALTSAGFSQPKEMAVPSPRLWVFKRSLAISRGQWAGSEVVLPGKLRRTALRADALDLLFPDGREFITVQAEKPRQKGSLARRD